MGVALISPHTAAAAVRINEIAWMGSSENANAEWIELYNDGGEDVSLSNWKLTGQGTAPNITLSGTIAANGYFLLERTSDASAAPMADKIYTGALSNSGDTLTLTDGTGAVIDTVIGGSNWQSIGGDNETKHTAQRTDSGWQTALATPKAANSTQGESSTATTTPESSTATTTPTATVGGSSAPIVRPKSPARTLYVDPGVDRIVATHVTTPFRALAFTEDAKVKDARITWSFGDGTRELGHSVRHAFRVPGEYLVVVRAEYMGTHAVETLRVLVEDANVAVRAHEEGSEITNNADTLLDLSNWKLSDGIASFTFPDDTALWPRSTVVFPYSVTGLSTSTALTLAYPDGRTAVVGEGMKPLAQTVGIEVVQEAPRPLPVIQPTYEDVVEAPIVAPSAPTMGAVYTPPLQKPTSPWLMCLFGSLLACTASFVVP